MPIGHADDAEAKSEKKQEKVKHSDKTAYDKKKTLAAGLLDLTILIANAAMLKAVIEAGSSHRYFEALLFLIILSIILQLIVAVLLLIIGAREHMDDINKITLHRLNTASVAFIILITVLNVFISALGLDLSND